MNTADTLIERSQDWTADISCEPVRYTLDGVYEQCAPGPRAQVNIDVAAGSPKDLELRELLDRWAAEESQE